MTAAVELLARCRTLGVELGVVRGATCLVWEAAGDPPADLLAALAQHKASVLALVRSPNGHCPLCGFALDDKRRCWRRGCCDRVCPCGGMTGSAFIELCHSCGFNYRDMSAPGAPVVIFGKNRKP